jgi:hypothetical protein
MRKLHQCRVYLYVKVMIVKHTAGFNAVDRGGHDI